MDDVYAPGTVLDIPKRPPWSYSMTKEQVEAQEEAMFEEYLKKIYSQHKPERLSYFEHNLEVSCSAPMSHQFSASCRPPVCLMEGTLSLLLCVCRSSQLLQ